MSFRAYSKACGKACGFIQAISILFCTHSFAMGSVRSVIHDDRPDAAPAILTAFQGSCGSQGIFTQSARSQTQAIINVIETLKATDPCKNYITELSSIQTAASQMQNLQTNSAYATYQTDQQYYQFLTLALEGAQPGSSEAQNIQSAIETLRLQMYNDQAAYNVSTQTSRHNLWVQQTSQMLNWGQQLTTTSSSPGLLQCLQQSPIAALELGTNLAAYGGSFLPGAFGASVAVIGQMINTGLEALRQGQYDEAEFAARGSEMPDALSCALESMTESYCNADDSYKLLDLARRNRLPDYTATPLWRGIDILSRQLPALLQWLGQIQNEVPPQDSYQASKQNAVLQEILEVQQQNLNAIATINNALDQAKAAPDQATKSVAIVNMIVTLSNQLVSSATINSTVGTTTVSVSSSTPFSIYQPNPVIWACWLVLGPDVEPKNCPPLPPSDQNLSGGNPSSLQMADYVSSSQGLGLSDPAKLAATTAMLIKHWNDLLPKAQSIVDADFARIMATNAGIILSKARVPANGFTVSPFEVLRNISSFLDQMTPSGNDSAQLSLTLAQEKQKINDALRQLTAPDNEVCPFFQVPISPSECQTRRLVSIFNIFQLKTGTQVFLTDINGLVNIDLENRFNNGAIPNGPKQVLQASGQDLSIALQAAGIGDLDPIADDLASARANIEENIQVFRSFFVKAFQEAVQRENAYTMDESPQDGPNRPHGQRLGELCMLWLLTSNIPLSDKYTAPNWPDQTTAKICESTLYFNENSNPTEERAEHPAFEIGLMARKLEGVSFRKRACLFHRYKIENIANTRFGITAPSGSRP